MNTQAPTEYKTLLTDIIRKQMQLLGPTFPLLLSKQVKGLKVAEDGQVLELTSEGPVVLKDLISQFLTVSETLVRISIEPVIQSVLGEDAHNELMKQLSGSQNIPVSEYVQSRL